MAVCKKSNPIRPVTAQQAKQIIKNTKDKPVIVKVFAHWCSACQESDPAAREAAGNVCENAEVLALDGDNAFNEAFVQEQKVEAFPTMLAFKNGKRVGKMEGGSSVKSFEHFYTKWNNKFNAMKAKNKPKVNRNKKRSK